MALFTNNPNIKSHFVNRWMLDYVPAVIKYGKKSKKKSTVGILGNTEHDDHLEGQKYLFKSLTVAN